MNIFLLSFQGYLPWVFLYLINYFDSVLCRFDPLWTSWLRDTWRLIQLTNLDGLEDKLVSHCLVPSLQDSQKPVPVCTAWSSQHQLVLVKGQSVACQLKCLIQKYPLCCNWEGAAEKRRWLPVTIWLIYTRSGLPCNLHQTLCRSISATFLDLTKAHAFRMLLIQVFIILAAAV